MHHFVNLGVSVSIILSFEKLDLILKLINIPQLVYVFENKSGNILSIENFKSSNIQEDMQIEMKHSRSCLWADYFINKIRNVCSTAKIVRKIKKKEKI